MHFNFLCRKLTVSVCLCVCVCVCVCVCMCRVCERDRATVATLHCHKIVCLCCINSLSRYLIPLIFKFVPISIKISSRMKYFFIQIVTYLEVNVKADLKLFPRARVKLINIFGYTWMLIHVSMECPIVNIVWRGNTPYVMPEVT